jgi:hypothetical protein
MIQFFKRLPYRSFAPVPLHSRSLHISRTLAGVTVATYPEPGLAAGLSVVVGGGPRYETEGTAGAAHFLKNYTFMVRCLGLRLAAAYIAKGKSPAEQSEKKSIANRSRGRVR